MPAPVETVIAAARDFLGERITTNAGLREHHSHGQDSQRPVMPDAVVFAETTEDVSRLLALCNGHGVAVVPYGTGTSLEGHVTPVRGGISLDLSRMTRILEINPSDLDCRVEAGVTHRNLNIALRDQGLFFSVDPGADASIGGMCATRASGTNAVRYGTIRENVLGLTAVMADGRVVRTGGRVRKSATGYDLTHLLIGSEGTLGVITEIQLRLHGIPEAASAAVCQFPTLKDAVETVITVMQAGIPVARIELLDEVQMGASIAYSKLDEFQPLPTLFFEFHGSPAGVAEQAQLVEEIAEGFEGKGFTWATGQEERSRLWRARHDGYWAGLSLRPGHRGIATDAVVPISKLAEVILGAKEDIAASGLMAPIVGHVGDGNFHTVILVPPEPDGMERAWALDRKIVARALALGGSCSGEHGVGLGKREFLVQEHGAEALAVMRSVKAALDPRGILNPGKLFID
ncbi:FAD-binding protein [Rhodovastum atsumiense]|uniref:D-lactate dehydrogenase (cytochrome) n=1 Tax=Rhodovastum atsumiense TaxID=504468 RepID=A0A5M6INR7_9PROT|nr:FAD-linked oxidase C-terminal domain-containing protein [Rhodovastum atsumiense]KAA5609913.1 FAD-binding protein [Rhodovastum atsumiense]CAH2604528.1 FAD-binding protein [Rhodovastum atsumiense]